MALQNSAGKHQRKVTVSLFANTGFNVSHIPAPGSLPAGGTGSGTTANPSKKHAATNKRALINTQYGIGTLDVACDSTIAEYIDYAIVITDSYSYEDGTGSDITTRKLTDANGTVQTLYQNDPVGGSINLSIRPAYYFVTGFTILNSGLVRFSVMLDCATTMGVGPGDFGGIMTRVPWYRDASESTGFNASSFDNADRDNVIPEPFTNSDPLVHEYQLINVDDIKSDLIATGASDTREVNIVLSPYDLNAVIDSGIGLETTTSETGSRYTYPSVDAAKTDTTFQIAAEASAGGASVAGLSKTYGVSAYYLTNAVIKAISQLYAAGISNPVYDAYRALVYSTVGGSVSDNTAFTSLRGIKYSYEVTPPDDFKLSLSSSKVNYYGSSVTLISLGTGDSQTLPLKEVCGTDGKITLDVMSDPGPEGGIYVRIRNLNETFPSSIPQINRGIFPGAVFGGSWRRQAIRATLGGQGVELGQTWKTAEIDIDKVTNQLNAEAAAAQYDLSVGNGYLLKNAGNEYGRQQLQANLNAQTASYNLSLKQNTQNMAVGALTDVVGMFTGLSGAMTSKDYTNLSGAFGSANRAAGGASNMLNAVNSMEQNAQSLANYANQAELQAAQLTDQGAYNIQNLSAQSAAAAQIAQAAQEKTELAALKTTQAPSVTYLCDSKGGIISGTTAQFLLVYTGYGESDKAKLSALFHRIGVAVNYPVNHTPCTWANWLGTQNKDQATWSFYKVTGQEQGHIWNGSAILSNGTYRNMHFPAWVIQGAIDQFAAGVWVCNGAWGDLRGY